MSPYKGIVCISIGGQPYKGIVPSHITPVYREEWKWLTQLNSGDEVIPSSSGSTAPQSLQKILLQTTETFLQNLGIDKAVGTPRPFLLPNFNFNNYVYTIISVMT